MSAQPPTTEAMVQAAPTVVTISDVPVPWYKSQKFTALWHQWVIMAAFWLAYSLETNVYNWRTGLAIPLLSSFITMFNDWRAPSIISPIGAMNRNNFPPAGPKPGA